MSNHFDGTSRWHHQTQIFAPIVYIVSQLKFDSATSWRRQEKIGKVEQSLTALHQFPTSDWDAGICMGPLVSNVRMRWRKMKNVKIYWLYTVYIYKYRVVIVLYKMINIILYIIIYNYSSNRMASCEIPWGIQNLLRSPPSSNIFKPSLGRHVLRRSCSWPIRWWHADV